MVSARAVMQITLPDVDRVPLVLAIYFDVDVVSALIWLEAGRERVHAVRIVLAACTDPDARGIC